MSFRLGIIGLGRVAYLLEDDPLRIKPCTHLGAWLTQNNVELVSACDIDPDRRRLFQCKYPNIDVYTDYEEMLTNEQLDLVSVCAYADKRSEMVINASEAGVKGIWCEKALSSSLDEAIQIRNILKKNNTRFIVSFMRRWHPRYQLIKKLLTDGVIGELQSINTHFSGNFIHTGTHAFDIMQFLAGEVSTVQAWLNTDITQSTHKKHRLVGKEYAEDCGGFALINYTNGIKGVVHGENKEYFRFELELLGSKGLVRIGNTQEELFRIGKSSYSDGLLELKSEKFPEYDNINHWKMAVEDLLQSIRSGNNVACGINEGITSLKIALSAHHSHQSQNQPVRFDELPGSLRVVSC